MARKLADRPPVANVRKGERPKLYVSKIKVSNFGGDLTEMWAKNHQKKR